MIFLTNISDNAHQHLRRVVQRALPAMQVVSEDLLFEFNDAVNDIAAAAFEKARRVPDLQAVHAGLENVDRRIAGQDGTAEVAGGERSPKRTRTNESGLTTADAATATPTIIKTEVVDEVMTEDAVIGEGITNPNSG